MEEREPEMGVDGEFVLEPGDEIVRRRGPLDELPARPQWLSGIGVFLLCGLASLNYWGKTEVGEFMWVDQASLFRDHEYWRVFTALFVHGDLGHLLSNAPLLLVFGFYLRAFFGLWVFPLGSVLVGGLVNALTVLNYEPAQRLIGASGMVYAMAGMWLVFYLRFDVRYSVPQRFLRVCGFVLMVLMPTTFVPEVSYLAHFLGFLLGILFAIILCPIFPFLQLPKAPS